MKENKTYTFNLCLLIITAVICTMKIVAYITSEYGYYTFEVSDWLINYEGGLVRRGLLGELLYVLYTIVPFSVKAAIKIINIVTFFLTTFFIVKASSNLRTSVLPFLTLLCGSISTLGWYRRDFLVLLVAYFVIMLHMKQLKKRNGGVFYHISDSDDILDTCS